MRKHPSRGKIRAYKPGQTAWRANPHPNDKSGKRGCFQRITASGKFAGNVHTQSTTLAGHVIASSMGTLSDIQNRNAGGMSMGNKYGNKKWELDGQVFDSQHEARRYQELRWLLRMGLISDLRRQVEYELIPSQKRGGKVVERPVKYIADFVYTENGEEVVEDAKGMRTKEYVIKRKLMLWQYGIQIREV